MEIIKQTQGIAVQKPDGTSVIYYIFPEYEIHYNQIPPQTIQEWHHHNVIEETIYVISGEVEVHWIDNKQKIFKSLRAGDIVRVENTPHTLSNSSNSIANFLVIRLILQGKDVRHIIKSDKLIDNSEVIIS